MNVVDMNMEKQDSLPAVSYLLKMFEQGDF